MNERDIFKLLEPLMVFGVILAVLVWQWWSIAAEIRRDRKRAAEKQDQ